MLIRESGLLFLGHPV